MIQGEENSTLHRYMFLELGRSFEGEVLRMIQVSQIIGEQYETLSHVEIRDRYEVLRID